MLKVIITLVLFLSFSFADSALVVKKGWQLIGSTSKIENMSIFKNKNVEQVWHFDAKSQKWLGYSPDSAIQKKMNDKGFSKISTLESWHGFWVKSSDEWVLTFASDTAKSDENITLQKGWNLISLPVNTVVSPHIFDGKTVWKYAKNSRWEYFEKDTKENFPTISHITNSDGIWVKSNKEQTISTVTDSAKLHNFSDVDEMKAYIRDMLLTHDRPICGYYPMMRGGTLDETLSAGGVALEDGAAAKNGIETPSAENASGTNLQEKGVDESDIVKHNDTHIFYVSRNPKNFEQMQVNITTFENITNNNLKPIDKIAINGSIDSMYLVDNRLVVLSRYGYKNYKPTKPTVDEKIAINHGGDVSSMLVDVFNVEDISDIQKVSSFKINGQLNSSRVVDGKLFLVTNFYPFVRKEYPRIYVDAPECEELFHAVPAPVDVGSAEVVKRSRKSKEYNYDEYKKYAKCYALMKDKDGRFFRYDYENPKITYERLMPYVQKDNNKEQMLITPQTFFAPCKKDQQPNITTVSKIDIQTADLEKTSSVLGYSGTVYASKNALYLVSNQYPMFFNFDRYQERSSIYKFSLDDELAYKASGFINGRVLNQFSLSEYDNILRIATTEGSSWQGDTLNSIYTLAQHEDALVLQGVLSGLGKEGEIIRSVRFMGNRGYVVTFEQTDPFYTIDLSDANNPVKVGELKIEGYSSYLHPIDENHILGIGRDADSEGRVLGLKMELFDIGNFSKPDSVSTVRFGSQYSYSEMEHNHKALAYRESDKLLGFAYSTYAQRQISSLGVFQISGNTINSYNLIQSPNTDRYNGGFERGLIFDFLGQTYVAYFANGQIAYSKLDDLK